MLTFVLKTILDDSISGDKIHGGYISGLTGLEVLAGGPGVDINAGNIDGTNIGTDVPGTGRFISLQIIGMQSFIEANVSWIGNLGNEVVGIHSLGDIGEILLKVGGLTKIKLNASPLIPSYFLGKLLIGTSTPLDGVSSLHVDGSIICTGAVDAYNVTATQGVFNSSLSFLTSGGMKTAYDLYDRFVPIETWYTSLGTNRRATLLLITDAEFSQLKNIDSSLLDTQAWSNLSGSRSFALTSPIWLNLYNSNVASISEAIWSLVGAMDQDVSSTSSPKFQANLGDNTRLIYKHSIDVNITGSSTSGVQQGILTYTLIGDGRASEDDVGICSCSLVALDGFLGPNQASLEVTRRPSGNWPAEMIPNFRRACSIPAYSGLELVSAIIEIPPLVSDKIVIKMSGGGLFSGNCGIGNGAATYYASTFSYLV